jgi:flagellar hook-length control protein FliK
MLQIPFGNLKTAQPKADFALQSVAFSSPSIPEKREDLSFREMLEQSARPEPDSSTKLQDESSAAKTVNTEAKESRPSKEAGSAKQAHETPASADRKNTINEKKPAQKPVKADSKEAVHGDAPAKIKAALQSNKTVADASKTAVQSNKTGTEASKTVVRSNKTVVDASKTATDACKTAVRSNKTGTEASKTVVRSCKDDTSSIPITEKKPAKPLKKEDSAAVAIAGTIAGNAQTVPAGKTGDAAKVAVVSKKAASDTHKKAVFTITDLRTTRAAPADKDGKAEAAKKTDKADPHAKQAAALAAAGKKPAQKAKSGHEAQLTVDVRTPAQTQPGAAPVASLAHSQAASNAGASQQAGGNSFADNVYTTLADRLAGPLSGDIAQAGSMVLRDNGAGSVRLNLKPASLGTVKIHLELADNKVTGMIIVDNEDALRAFSQQVHSLETAFRNEGFDGASMQMSLAGSQTGNNGGTFDGNQGAANAPAFVGRRTESAYEAASAPVSAGEVNYWRPESTVSYFA